MNVHVTVSSPPLFQSRQRHGVDPDSQSGSSDAPLSLIFDMDNSSDARSNQESNRETGQRNYNQRDKPSYRQGIPT